MNESGMRESPGMNEPKAAGPSATAGAQPGPSQAAGGADRDALALLVRQRMDHEVSLLSQRTTWIVMAQSFLFTAFAAAAGGAADDQAATHFGRMLSRLVGLLPWTAIGCIVSYYVSACSALFVLAKLRESMNASDPNVEAALLGPKLSTLGGHVAPMVLPLVFLATWAAVLVTR
jgi:hypothetical protein